MDIKDLKELEKLFKLCRKQGIAKMTLNNMSFELGDIPNNQPIDNTAANMLDDPMPVDPYAGFPDEELSPEELAYFASGGTVKENPYRN